MAESSSTPDPLPEDVNASLVSALSVYIRSVPRAELPGRLRRLVGFRPRTVRSRHGGELIAALDDPGLRANVLHWLEDPPAAVSSEDADKLRIAAERADGWRQALAERSKGPVRKERTPSRDPTGSLHAEREKVKRARAEARAAREESRRELQTQRARATQLERRIQELEGSLERVEAQLETQGRRHESDVEELERRLRRAQRDLDKAKAEESELKTALKEERRRVRELSRRSNSPRQPRPEGSKPKPPRRDAQPGRARRSRLRPPPGRLEDDPDTLDEWLSTYEVQLLVDGYNVARSLGGYGDVTPETWRRRLEDDLDRYARVHRVPTIVVWDGQQVAPGTPRRRRRGSPVEVEYSKPPEIADDHIVAVLERLPPDPVIVVTDDRELQRRVGRLGATIARSGQLLALIRR